MSGRQELDRVLFRFKKDPSFRDEFFLDLQGALKGYDLTGEEKKALADRDYARLYDLGAKDDLIIPLARESMQRARSVTAKGDA